MILGKIFSSLLKVLKQLLTHSGNSEKEALVLNDPDSNASKSVLEIKPMLPMQPVLSSASLTYGLSTLPVTLDFSRDRCGLCSEAGCLCAPHCTRYSCATAVYAVFYHKRRGNSQTLLPRMGLHPCPLQEGR